ncbi:MAG: hypothetical protein PHH00_01040 [Candidatus Nanoarchaeia archaeon]|nr:hypothetical protein [Candidatus Nanoarchaeia archaeon]
MTDKKTRRNERLVEEAKECLASEAEIRRAVRAEGNGLAKALLKSFDELVNNAGGHHFFDGCGMQHGILKQSELYEALGDYLPLYFGGEPFGRKIFGINNQLFFGLNEDFGLNVEKVRRDKELNGRFALRITPHSDERPLAEYVISDAGKVYKDRCCNSDDNGNDFDSKVWELKRSRYNEEHGYRWVYSFFGQADYEARVSEFIRGLVASVEEKH